MQIDVLGHPRICAALVRVLNELFGRTAFTVNVRQLPDAPGNRQKEAPAAPATTPFVRVTVDARSLAMTVRIEHGASHRTMDRRELPPANSVELAIEETSHVVYGMVDAAFRAESMLDERPAPPTGPTAAPGPTAPAPPTGPTAAPGPTAPAPPDARAASGPHADAHAAPPSPSARASVPSRNPPGIEAASMATGTDGASSAASTTAAAAAAAAAAASTPASSSRQSPSPWSLHGALSGYVGTPGGGLVWSGGGGGLELRYGRGTYGAGLRLSGAVLAATEARQGPLEAEVRPFPFRLLPSFQWSGPSRRALVVGLGAGADWFYVSPQPGPPDVYAARASSYLAPVLTALAEARFPLVGGIDVQVGLLLDVDLAGYRYVVQSGAERSALFAPAAIRPSLFTGISFPILAPSHSEDVRYTGEVARHEGR